MNLSILSGCRLFAGIPAARIPALLHSLGAYEKRYAKGQPIYRVGDIAHALCIVLSGSVTIERDDAWGNKSILDHLPPGAVFAEVYACVPDTPMMVSAVAAEPSEVLFPARVAAACARSARKQRPRHAAAQPAGRRRAQKPDPDAQDLPHHAQVAARAAAVLPVRAGGAERQRCVRHPVRPPAARGLPERRPQRAVGRAGQNAARRADHLPQKPLCAAPQRNP